MASPRRIGSETSKTRALVLDAAERVMLKDGYAAVTYRSLAEGAGVTPGLVQYYFPTLDDMFLALLRRRSEHNHERLLAELERRGDEPLRIIWEFSSDETSAALLTEFMALANHRKVIRAAILEVTQWTRKVQMEALRSRWEHYRDSSGGLSPEALLFLLHMIPKMIQLEESFGMSVAHDEILRAVEGRLEVVEPGRKARSSGVGAKGKAPVRARAGRSPGRRGVRPSGSDR
jgi:TetR/AcrR family transcriptional regulator, transcriptional repressor for nem operon